MQYLVFDLHGPMASWGDIGYGTHRPTLPRPTKSAILGLLGAALGYGRNEDEGHASLRDSLGVAVWVDAEGEALRDYHTIQVPSRQRNLIHTTRRNELTRDPGSLNTILSTRDYVTGAWYSVALWRRSTSGPTLETLHDALLRPRFALYLGRRSCPLAIHVQPRIVEATTHVDAFRRAAAQRAVSPPSRLRAPTLFFDRAPGDPESGSKESGTTESWDEPESLSLRIFRPRNVVRATLKED